MRRFIVRLVVTHLAISLALTILAAQFGSSEARFSALTGSAVGLLGVFALVFAWRNILAKKHVALSVAVIVIKYAILGSIIYIFSSRYQAGLGWLAAGIGFSVLSLVANAKALEQELSELSSAGGVSGSL